MANKYLYYCVLLFYERKMHMSKKDLRGRVLRNNESQMKDGRYRYRYTDNTGKRRVTYSWKLVPSDRVPKGKRDCISLREREAEIQKELSENTFVVDGNITVNQLVERCFKTKANVKKQTMAKYVYIWEHNIKNNPIGSRKICDIRKSDILMFYKFLHDDLCLSNSTIGDYHTVLNPAFQLAVDDGLIQLNPCRGCLKNYPVDYSNSKKMPLTQEQENLLIEFLNQNKKYSRYKNLIVILLETGMRISEALGLTWNEVDLKNKRIYINHQVRYFQLEKKYQYISSSTKNRRSRMIPLSTKAFKAFLTQKKLTYFISKNSDFSVDEYTDFVFINNTNDGTILNYTCLLKAFHNITDKCNEWEEEKALLEHRENIILPDILPHVLRHTFCSKMAIKGMNPKHLQEIMGHSDIRITMQIYTHLSEDDLKNELRRIECL